MSKKQIPNGIAEIGNYRILKTIGKGSFAKVKLARHVTTNVEVIFLSSYEMSWRILVVNE